jgi:hypothetical protein
MKAYGEVDIQIHIFLTSALDGAEWLASRPGLFTSRHPFDRRLDGPQNRRGQRGENSWLYRDSKSDPWVVQPVASRYTDYAIPASQIIKLLIILFCNPPVCSSILQVFNPSINQKINRPYNYLSLTQIVWN